MNLLINIVDRMLPEATRKRETPIASQDWLKARLLVGSSLLAIMLIIPGVCVVLNRNGLASADGVVYAGLSAVLLLPLTTRWHRFSMNTCAALVVLASSVAVGIECFAHGFVHVTILLWAPALIAGASAFVSARFGIILALLIGAAIILIVAGWSAGWVELSLQSAAEQRLSLAIDGSCSILLAAAIAWLNDYSHRQIQWQLEAAHQQLVGNQMQLVEAYRMASLGELAGGVAHEINNPLTAIGLRLNQVSLVVGDNAALAKPLEDIRSAVTRINRVVLEVRKYAGIDEAGELYSVSLAAIVANATVLYGGLISTKNVAVRANVADNLFVIGQLAPLTQVVANLLVNASQALAGEPGGLITISAKELGDKLRLVVEDSGPGVSPTQIDRIFDPFFTTHHPGDGYGLGLSVAQSIIHRHRGRLYYDGGDGVSRFVVEMPRALPVGPGAPASAK